MLLNDDDSILNILCDALAPGTNRRWLFLTDNAEGHAHLKGLATKLLTNYAEQGIDGEAVVSYGSFDSVFWPRTDHIPLAFLICPEESLTIEQVQTSLGAQGQIVRNVVLLLQGRAPSDSLRSFLTSAMRGSYRHKGDRWNNRGLKKDDDN